MTTPLLGDRVDVGGCVGQIHALTTDTIEVRGEYHHVEGGVDHWRIFYRRKRFEKAIWDEGLKEWDASNIVMGHND